MKGSNLLINGNFSGILDIYFESFSENFIIRSRIFSESVILLSNDGVLPIASSMKRIAVIGPGADDERLLQGDYHYPSHLEMNYQAPQNLEATGLVVPKARGSYAPGAYFAPHVTPLAGLRAALGKDVEVRYAKGCDVLGDNLSGFVEAVKAARDSELAIVVVTAFYWQRGLGSRRRDIDKLPLKLLLTS